MAVVAAIVTVASASALARQAPPKTTPPAPNGGPERFTVQSDGHPVALWARRPSAPKGAVLFVHGRTWSGRPDFDLQVAGYKRSVLASFAAQGYAAYAVDLRGYGATPRDASGWLTPKRAAADISNVLGWIATQHPALPKPTLVGWSRGAVMAGMVAIASPQRLTNVVLFGFAFDPELEFGDAEVPPTVTYDLNRLQRLTTAEQYCVTLNPDGGIDDRRVLRRFVYRHPLYTREAIRAQRQWGDVSGVNRTHFCGAYWFYGFHEDGLTSAIRVASALGVQW